jgi:hypothetical protein
MPLHPFLRGCELRLQRANRYVREAQGLMHAFATECEDRIVTSYDVNQALISRCSYLTFPRHFPQATR